MNTKTLAGKSKNQKLTPPFSSEKSGLFLSAKASGGVFNLTVPAYLIEKAKQIGYVEMERVKARGLK